MKKIQQAIKAELKIVLAWLVYFLLNEILISGGKHERNIYLFIFNIIVIVVILFVFRKKFISQSIRQRITQGIIYSATFAILDYLVVNLLLYSNNLFIFKSYQSYVYWGLLLIAPISSDYITAGYRLLMDKIKFRST